ncbi:Coiled-coil domain-containing protein 86, partial [Ophiophagus hannah]
MSLAQANGASETVSEGVPLAAAWSREKEADAGNERGVGLRQLPAKDCKLIEGKKRLSRGTVTEHGNVRIITQTVPQTGSLPTPAATVRVVDSASAASKFLLTHNKKIKNTLLNVIGIMQIIFGVTQVSFGIALTAAQQNFTITVQSGIYFWLGILLLITGSLLTEVEKRQSDLLVKSAFIVNMIFCVVGLVAIILHGIEIAQTVKEGNPCDSNPSHYCRNYYQILSLGLNSVFLIFVLLEVSIAIVAISRLRTQKQESYQPMELLQADRLSREPERGEQLQQLGNEEGSVALVEAGSGKLQIAALGKKRKEAASIPKGKPKSGRVWKDPGKKRFSHMIQDKPLHTSWQHKMKIRQEKKLIKDFAQELKEQKQREREEKKQRRRDNLKRRLENERKAEVVQVIRNPLKLKRAKKKHLRRIEKRDTLSLLQNSQAQLKAAKQ